MDINKSIKHTNSYFYKPEKQKLVFNADLYLSIGALAKLKTQHQEDPTSVTLATNKPTLLRSLFTVGALCRHFDYDQEEFKGTSKVNSSPQTISIMCLLTSVEPDS